MAKFKKLFCIQSSFLLYHIRIEWINVLPDSLIAHHHCSRWIPRWFQYFETSATLILHSFELRKVALSLWRRRRNSSSCCCCSGPLLWTALSWFWRRLSSPACSFYAWYVTVAQSVARPIVVGNGISLCLAEVWRRAEGSTFTEMKRSWNPNSCHKEVGGYSRHHQFLVWRYYLERLSFVPQFSL